FKIPRLNGCAGSSPALGTNALSGGGMIHRNVFPTPVIRTAVIGPYLPEISPTLRI
ncbi:hypothetical protein LCGC14_2639770, partial [marine sediment metagenome]